MGRDEARRTIDRAIRHVAVAALALIAASAHAQEEDRALRLAKAAAREEGSLALLLAREACRAADREECRTALYGALAKGGALPVFRHAKGARVWSCGMPRNAERVYSLDEQILRIWMPDGSAVARIPGAKVRWWAFDHIRVGVVRHGEKRAVIYDPSGVEIAALSHPEPVGGIWIAGKGRVVVTWSGRHVRLWDESGRPLAVIPHPQPVRMAYARRDGGKVFTLTEQRACIYATDGRLTAQWEPPAAIAGVRWAPAQDRLLARSESAARLRDARGRELAVLKLHTAPLTEARFSLDGDLIVTTSRDGWAILWNAVGEPLRILQHAYPVDGAEFLPQGRHFVTFGRNEAWLWTRRGFLVARLCGHSKRVTGVGYSGQADRVVTCAEDGTARLWPIVLEDALALAARHAGRDFTAEERRRYGSMLTGPPERARER
ncbi:MAG: WD40 repeat domain-containing protein [Planctomycetota bacterium]|jgi:WD40 repeat protein